MKRIVPGSNYQAYTQWCRDDITLCRSIEHICVDRFGARPFLQILNDGFQFLMDEIEFGEEGLKGAFANILIDGLLKHAFVGLNHAFELI